MAKKIPSEIAIGIIVFFAVIIGYSFWKSNNIAVAPTINTSVTTTTVQPAVSDSGTVCQDWFKILSDGSEVKMSDPNCKENTDISGWQTYRNDKYGFEVKYPTNWIAGDDKLNSTSWQKSFYNPETKASLDKFNKQDHGEAPAPIADIVVAYSENLKNYLFQVTPTSYATLDDYVKNNPSFSNVSQIDFAGGKAWFVDETAFVIYQSIIIEHKGHIFSLLITKADSKQDALLKYNQILSTFKFTK